MAAWYSHYEALATPSAELIFKGVPYRITRYGTRLDRPVNQLSAVCSVRNDHWYRATDEKGVERDFLQNPDGTFELTNRSHFFGAAPVTAPSVSATNLKYDPNEAKREAGKLLARRLQFGFIPGTVSFHNDAKEGSAESTPAHKNTSQLTYMHQTLGNLLHHIAHDERARDRLEACPEWPVSSSAFHRADPAEIRGWLKCYAMLMLDAENVKKLLAVAPPDPTDPLAMRILQKAKLK